MADGSLAEIGKFSARNAIRVTIRAREQLRGAEGDLSHRLRGFAGPLCVPGRAKALGACGALLMLVMLCAATVGSAAVAQTETKKAAPKAVHAKATAAADRPISKSYGSSSAPIKMEVFTDYQCPSCRNLFEQTLRPLINDYVASGKVYLVHHDFPLSSHQYSGQAARWANAAAIVGEFGNVESALYDNQETWEQSGDVVKFVSGAMSAAEFKRAEDIVKGCDYAAITSKPDGSDPLTGVAHPCGLDIAIAQDVRLGYQIPVRATPTYVITYKGQRLPAGSGFVSWPILKQFFDSLESR
jgi:protein-disulfide isomerase